MPISITVLRLFTTHTTMGHLKELPLIALRMVCTIPKLKLALVAGNKWLIKAKQSKAKLTNLARYTLKDRYDLIFN